MAALRNKGFTLLELLVVLVVIAILATMSFAGIRALHRMAQRTSTAGRAQVLVNAIKAYKTDYPNYPGQVQGASDRTYDDTTYKHAVFLTALTNNPRRKVYSEVAENITTNSYLDYWGRPYVIAIDENGDGVVDINATFGSLSFTSNGIRETVAVMSWGFFPSNSAERLCSWIR